MTEAPHPPRPPAPPLFRVTVTGSECTGKTTLAEALAGHYETLWVPEYARQFVLDKGAPAEHGDVEIIARGQIEREEDAARAARQRGSRLLVLDTDLLSSVIYSRHYDGHCPAWIEEALRERAADLYLLADIDVPWRPDGDQRDRGDRREEMQALFRESLVHHGYPFEEIRGSRAERLERACRAVDRRLAENRAQPDERAPS